MIKVYINYPNPHVTIHCDSSCGDIQSDSKPGQRYRNLNVGTLSQELAKFRAKQYRFAADQDLDEIWLEIDFQNQAFELAVPEFACYPVGIHYRPPAIVKPQVHFASY